MGTSLCRARPGQARALRAFDDDDNDVSEHFLRYDPQQEGGSIVTSSPCVPVMLTLDERVIRQDCLGYVMKRRRLIFEREGLAAHSSG